MASLLPSAMVHSEIDDLLLRGKAATAYEAEEMFLDSHLLDLVQLVKELSNDNFERHEAIKLLMSHGSRPREDSRR